MHPDRLQEHPVGYINPQANPEKVRLVLMQ